MKQHLTECILKLYISVHSCMYVCNENAG